MEYRDLALRALDSAYQQKVEQLYDTLLNAMTVSPEDRDAQLEACEQFAAGLKLVTATHKKAVELAQASF